MMYAQYCRIESACGGVSCTPRELIREFRTRITKKGKSRVQRKARQHEIHALLAHHVDARKLYSDVVSGRWKG